MLEAEVVSGTGRVRRDGSGENGVRNDLLVTGLSESGPLGPLGAHHA